LASNTEQRFAGAMMPQSEVTKGLHILENHLCGVSAEEVCLSSESGKLSYEAQIQLSGPGKELCERRLKVTGRGTLSYGEETPVILLVFPHTHPRFVDWAGNVDTIAGVSAASTTITTQGNYEIAADCKAISHSTYKLI
jgi:hypothetical protein